jgi:hypothetical protein
MGVAKQVAQLNLAQVLSNKHKEQKEIEETTTSA